VRLALSGHVHVNQIQQEKDVWYVSSPSLAVYPCAYRIFRVSPQAVTVETYQISYSALIKKARKQLENWSLPYKFNPKVQAFCELLEGAKEDQNVRLSLKVPGKKTEVNQPKIKKGKDSEEPKDKDKNRHKEKDQAKDQSKESNKDKSKHKSGDKDKQSKDKNEKEPHADAPLTKDRVLDEKQMNDVKEQNSDSASPTPASSSNSNSTSAPNSAANSAQSTDTTPSAATQTKSPPTPAPIPSPSAKSSPLPVPSPILPTAPDSGTSVNSTAPNMPPATH
jgi:hypothetical protein